MVVDVPQIKSKWVGESEKNIKALFDRYRTLVAKFDVAPILLFNEADAIIGIRKQGAQNAVDKMENTVQNIILQEMETLDGILIATTNLTENLDSAFERRFLFKIKFENPSTEAKTSIWMNKLTWLNKEDAAQFAKDYDFSGGQIDNIVRKVAMNEVITGERPAISEINNMCKTEKIENPDGAKRMGFCL
jgi:SpoVK/Ycf46/Vps4 family AAA+-type ATPase